MSGSILGKTFVAPMGEKSTFVTDGPAGVSMPPPLYIGLELARPFRQREAAQKSTAPLQKIAQFVSCLMPQCCWSCLSFGYKIL